MLDLALIRAEPARVKAVLARRGVGPQAVDAVTRPDGQWAARQEVREALRLRRRRVSEEYARLKDDGGDTSDLETHGRRVAGELAAVDAEMAALEARRLKTLLALPNLPMTDVPDAAPADAAPPAWPKPFPPLHHADLLEMLGLAAPPHAPGLGRGFLVWRGRGARLLRALVNFMLDLHTGEFGCEEVRVPALASRAALTGSAHLPLLEDGMYGIRNTACESQIRPGGQAVAHNLFLAPRAEPHLAHLYAGEVLDAGALPVRLVAAGPAFRREAGGRGAAGRGLLRLHEFPTVELYTVCRPDQDEAELQRAAAAAQAIVERLEVPWRRALRPAPDLSHAAAKTVDLEVWAPGTAAWLAVAALSTFTDYQARRTDTRWRDARGQARLVHTVGGAAVALPHLVAALLENGQEADGSVRLPAALAPYLGGEAGLLVRGPT